MGWEGYNAGLYAGILIPLYLNGMYLEIMSSLINENREKGDYARGITAGIIYFKDKAFQI